MGALENLFGKKFNTPVLKPMGPFLIAGVIVFYGINSVAGALANSDEFRNDPRNAAARKNAGH